MTETYFLRTLFVNYLHLLILIRKDRNMVYSKIRYAGRLATARHKLITSRITFLMTLNDALLQFEEVILIN